MLTKHHFYQYIKTLLFVLICLAIVAPSAAFASIKQAEGIPTEVQNVQKGNYDIIVLPEELGENVRNSISTTLEEIYGTLMIHWAVSEEYGTNYVYAYPFQEDLYYENQPDQSTQSTRLKLKNILTDSSSNCTNLFQHYFFLGTNFQICGEYHGYPNLSVYGFNNKGSSYYEDNIGCVLKIYDGYNYKNYLTSLYDDIFVFGSWLNDKASSLYGGCG